MKKIGLICMALVVALGTLGVGYAMWSDTITITGTVNTGDVDLDIVDFSGTWMYKQIKDAEGDEAHGAVKLHGWGDIDSRMTPTVTGEEAYSLISYAETISKTADPDANTGDWDAATVKFQNLLPDEMFMVDFLIHYNGSIPARLKVTVNPEAEAVVTKLMNAGYMQVYGLNTVPGDPWASPPLTPITLEGMQVHNCEYYIIKVVINIPQSGTQAEYSGLTSGTFTITVEAQQWNEYPS